MELDAVVIGAGVAGLYQLHQLREQGLRVRAYEAGDDLGGAWWWHAYPGARVDTEGYLYQYLFSRELYDEWSWSERFPAGYEVLRWLRFLADRLDLRRDIRFATRVVSAHYDADRGRWTVRTDGGDTVDTRVVVSCAGVGTPPPTDVPPGRETFAGPVLHTSHWPRKGPDLAGLRVGVVGVDATGIQLVPKIAAQVGHLTVFAGTPRYVLPMKNPVYGWQDREAYKARFGELTGALPRTATGFDDDAVLAPADATPAVLEELYQDGSLRLWRAIRGAPSAVVSEFVRDKMRERLADPRLAEVLVPTDEAFGAHRVPLDNGYLEVFHRDDVTLVGTRDTPVRRLRPEGVELADGTVHALDVVVVADAADPGVGALVRIDVRGRDGRSLADEWAGEVRTTLGLAAHGYPNLFTTAAPLAPSAAVANTTAHLQRQTEWITAAVRDLHAAGGSTMEATAAGEDAWVAHHDRSGTESGRVDTLAWQPGAGVVGAVGERARALTYPGGVGAYLARCTQEAEAGYPAFTRT